VQPSRAYPSRVTETPASPAAPAGVLRLLDLRDVPLDVQEVLDAVADERAGGVVSFTGVVRDSDGGRAVRELEYVAHPDAAQSLTRVAQAVADDVEVLGLAAVHRTGLLAVGDVAVVVAASAAHRGEAFEAARRLIDDLKAGVPVWKRQVFAEGDEEWVGTP
jgi:molybdopterin synthase catalytic subunit